MTPRDADPEDKDRRPKSPFDEFFRGMGLDPREFDRLFDDMQRSLQEAFRNMGGIEPGRPYVHGFSFKIGPDGKPQISEFGNRPQRPSKGAARPVFSEEREPVTDLIEEAKQISVTMELPGIDKKDIDIRVAEHELEIHVDTPHRKYYKSLKLPAPVKPTTTKATYKNGVLDVVVEKERPPQPKAGHRVKVE